MKRQDSLSAIQRYGLQIDRSGGVDLREFATQPLVRLMPDLHTDHFPIVARTEEHTATARPVQHCAQRFRGSIPLPDPAFELHLLAPATSDDLVQGR